MVLYQIEQSVKPNELVKKSYIYFRITYSKTKLLERFQNNLTFKMRHVLVVQKTNLGIKLFEQIQWLELSSLWLKQKESVMKLNLFIMKFLSFIINLTANVYLMY